MEDNLANSVIFARQKSDSVSANDSDFNDDTSVTSASRCNFNILNSARTSSLGSFNSFERCIPGDDKPTSFSHIRQFSGIPRTEDVEISPQSLDDGTQRAFAGSIVDRHSSMSALYDGASPPLQSAKLPQKSSVSSFFANQPDAMADALTSEKLFSQANVSRTFRDRAEQSERSIIEPEGQFLEIARICAVNLAQYEHLAGFLTKINLGQPQSAPCIPRVVAPAGATAKNALDLLKTAQKILPNGNIGSEGPENMFPGVQAGKFACTAKNAALIADPASSLEDRLFVNPRIPSDSIGFQSAQRNQKPSILRSADTSGCQQSLQNGDNSFRTPRNLVQIQACAVQISEIANAAYSSHILQEDANLEAPFPDHPSQPASANALQQSEDSINAFAHEFPENRGGFATPPIEDRFCAVCDRITVFLASEVATLREEFKASSQSARPCKPAVAVPEALMAKFKVQMLLDGQESPRLLSLRTDVLGRLVLAICFANGQQREQLVIIAHAAALGAPKAPNQVETPCMQRVLVFGNLGQQFEFLVPAERWTAFSQLLSGVGLLVERDVC